jgi:amino acid permease
MRRQVVGPFDFDWSAVKTFVNTCKGFVGASSFELPWAVSQAGVWGGFFGLIGFAFVGTYGMLLIVKCASLMQADAPTYPDLGEVYGRMGRIISWFCIVFVYIGAGGAYFVFISKAMSDLTIGYNSDLTPDVWTVIVLPVVIGLSLIRQYSLLACTSVLGLSAAIIAIVFTIYDAASYQTIAPMSEYPQWRVDTYPLFMGNAAFLYLLPTVVLPLHQSMCQMDLAQQGHPAQRSKARSPRTKKKDKKRYDTIGGREDEEEEEEEEEREGRIIVRTGDVMEDTEEGNEYDEEEGDEYKMDQIRRFEGIFKASVIFVTCINIPFALFAYLCYGEKTADNVIENLQPGVVTNAVKVLLCIDLLFTGVLFLFPVTEGLDREFFTDKQLGIASPLQEDLKEQEGDGGGGGGGGGGYGTSPRSSPATDDGSDALHAMAPKEREHGGGWLVECQRNTLRAVLVIMTAVVSKAIPYFGLITGLSGALGNNLLGLIVPPLVYIKLQHRVHHWDPLAVLFPCFPCFEQPSPLPSKEADEHDSPMQRDTKQATTTTAWWRLVDLSLALATMLFGITFLIMSTSKYAEELANRLENEVEKDD